MRLKMHLEAVIVLTCRQKCAELGDTLRSCDRASLNMHSEAVIEQEWRCTCNAVIVQTWRPQSCKFGDILGGSDFASLDTHSEATIEQV
jgi:hypothetical protein